MPTVAAQSQRNGVDVAKLFATLDAVKAHPEAASFRFGVTNRWISGTHNRSEISTFYGVGAEQQHDSTFAIEADHPAVLVGGDAAPTPAELLLAALASCLTSGLGNIAAVRKINLESVESRVEGDIDLRGILGLSDEVRNGFSQIRVSFRVRGDASPEALRHRSAIRPRSTTTWSAPCAVRQRLTARPAWPAPTIRVSTARMVLFPLRWSRVRRPRRRR